MQKSRLFKGTFARYGIHFILLDAIAYAISLKLDRLSSNVSTTDLYCCGPNAFHL